MSCVEQTEEIIGRDFYIALDIACLQLCDSVVERFAFCLLIQFALP